MKRTAAILLMLLVLLTSMASASNIRGLFVNGMPMSLNDHVIIGGSYFVPVRHLADALGFTVRWDERARRAYLHNSTLQVAITSTEVLVVNDEERIMEKKPFLRQGQLFVPLRALVETLGWQVDYSDTSGTIFVHSPDYPNRQIFVSSGYLDAVVSRVGLDIDVELHNKSATSINTLAIVTAKDGRVDFVSWVDRESGKPVTMLSPGERYYTKLQFPPWVNSIDFVDVVWVDSTRFRGLKPQASDCFMSFSLSFRPPGEKLD